MSCRKPGGPIRSLTQSYVRASVTVQHPVLRGQVIHQFEGYEEEMAQWLRDLATMLDSDIAP